MPLFCSLHGLRAVLWGQLEPIPDLWQGSGMCTAAWLAVRTACFPAAPPTAAIPPAPLRPHARLPPQTLLLAAAATWLLFCTYMFHGVLEVQLSVSDTPEAQEVPPTERKCGGLFRSWCEQRVAQYRAQAVRQGMQHAWAGYKAYAWGADEIHPKSKSAKTDIMVRRPWAGPCWRWAARGQLSAERHGGWVEGGQGRGSRVAALAGTLAAAAGAHTPSAWPRAGAEHRRRRLACSARLWCAGRRRRVWHGGQHGGCAVHAEGHGPAQGV